MALQGLLVVQGRDHLAFSIIISQSAKSDYFKHNHGILDVTLLENKIL